MAFFIITISKNQFKMESQRIRSQYYDYQRDIIKNEMDNLYEYIYYYVEKSENNLKDNIQQQIYIIYDIIFNYYEKNKDKPINELREEVAQLVQNVSSLSTTKYYFTLWLDDQDIPIARSNNNCITTDMLSFEKNNQILEAIQDVKKKGEGFYEYEWCMKEDENDEGTLQRKLGFFKYFEELNIFIGTGIYLDEMEHVIKKDLLERIHTIRYGNGGYFYVTTYEGVALVFAEEDYLGTDVSGIIDIDGINIHKEGLKHIQTAGEGYISYTWTKPGEKGLYPKLTYVRGYTPWNWIIGTGVYVDEVEGTIADIEQKMKDEITSNLAKVLIVVGLLALFFLFFQYHVVRKIINLLQQEDEINSIITDLSVDGILIVNKEGRILESNRKGIELIGISYRGVKEIRIWDMFQDEVLTEDNKEIHIFKETSLVNLNGDTIPVEVHMKLTTVDRQKVYITYLRDLTKRYRYEKKLKEMALMDELTGVYNRRFIIGQIEKEIESHRVSGRPMAIAMADLDFFKKVNDTYGHTYGDEILKYFSKTLLENVNCTDYVGRYGGEEFIIVFTNKTKEEAYESLRRIQEKMRAHIFEKKELKLTFSAGIVEVESTRNQNMEDYLIAVDELLYLAKDNGRDRIELVIDKEQAIPKATKKQSC